MAGTPYQILGPDTLEVSVAVTEGQGVEPDTANPGMVKPWTAGSTKCIGVARTEAAPKGSNAMTNFAPTPRTTGVQWTGDVRVVYAAAAGWMQPLIAAANGQVTPAKANEVQTVTVTGAPTGGTFTLTWSGQTTAAIAYNATAAAVQSALEALSNIAPGDVIVTGAAGGPYTVTFVGVNAGTDVAQMTASGAGLTGGTTPSVTVATTTAGGGTIDALQVIGRCTEPLGVVAGATGRIRLTL
jgi:hypothetical protein